MVILQNADRVRTNKLLHSAAEMYLHHGSRIYARVTHGLSRVRPTEVANSPKIRQSLADRPISQAGIFCSLF